MASTMLDNLTSVTLRELKAKSPEELLAYAEELEIESSVIAPRAALEQIAWEADPAEHLLGWQRSLLEL